MAAKASRSPVHTPADAGSAVFRILALTASALVIGLTVSLAAIAFVEIVAWLNNVLLVSPRTRVQYESRRWLIVVATLVVPVIGGLLVGWLLFRVSPVKRPLGPVDVVAGVQLTGTVPVAKGGVISTLAAVISLGFGASVGQYGPLVYLGAMLGNIPGRLPLRIPNFSAIAMSCGVAAAISTAFNAPIAGLVFAHEVILRHYSIQAFAPTTVAAATGYVVANVMFERDALFRVDFAGVQYGHEFLLFALLGLLASGVAIGFMHLTLFSARLSTRIPMNPMLRPGLAGLAVGVTALWLPDVMGVGKETLRFATIDGAFLTWELALLVVAKVTLTALCIGFGFAGGVFSPALLIGILFGALCWSILDTSTAIATSGVVAYAICGMMAVTSAVIGAPLTTILIVFELTRNYDLTIAAMVAVVFSNLVAYRLFGRSLFDVQLARRGVDLSVGRDHARLSTQFVSELATTSFYKCSTDEFVVQVLRHVGIKEDSEIFVVDDDQRLVGVLDTRDSTSDQSVVVSELMNTPTLTFNETTTLPRAMRGLENFSGEVIPIVDSSSGRLTAIVTESVVIRAYLNAIDGLRQEENAPA